MEDNLNILCNNSQQIIPSITNFKHHMFNKMLNKIAVRTFLDNESPYYYFVRAKLSIIKKKILQNTK